MDYAKLIPCKVVRDVYSSKYWESIRIFQGCPTIAVTKGGRIFAGWYAGGTREPHMNNYNLLIVSDDGGETWSKPIMVIPSSYEYNIHSLDIQLFLDPNGILHILWVQNNTEKVSADLVRMSKYMGPAQVDGYRFGDFVHAEWEITCSNPDADLKSLEFTEPKFIYNGFLRCKPTFIDNDNWVCFAYDQMTDTYGYNLTHDGGKTFTRHYSGKKLKTDFDETMAYKMDDGTLRMLARCGAGCLAECYSYDNGLTWTDAKNSGIVSADTRFFVQKLPSGRVLLINNDCPDARSNMTVQLSEDDGKTWKYKKCIDERDAVSYPDADYRDGKIYLVYDRGRTTHKEIIFAVFSEDDIINGNEIELKVISRPLPNPDRAGVIESVNQNKLIAIIRGVDRNKLIPMAEALYKGGIRLLEITYSANGSTPDSQTADSIKALAEHFKGRMFIGAGTVLTLEQVRLTRAAGGQFIISPNVKEEVIRETCRLGMVSMPGALTPTEIANAHEFGADFVKLFPISDLGAGYVKAVKAPLSNVKLLAVGGINENNMADYLNVGVCGFGIGSNLTDKKLIEAEDWDGITRLAEKFVKAVN